MDSRADILKVPLVNSAVIAATTFIEGITDVLQVLILLATLMWTIVKIAKVEGVPRGRLTLRQFALRHLQV